MQSGLAEPSNETAYSARFQLVRQRVGPLRDRTGSKADHVIAGRDESSDDSGKLLRTGKRNRLLVPVRKQAGDQRITVDTGDRCLAGRIDRRHDHRIGVVETRTELLKQITQPRIAVRL